MDLGRFHAVVRELARHFELLDLPGKLVACAAALDQYAQTRAPARIEEFRGLLADLRQQASTPHPELQQPLARQVTLRLGLDGWIGEALWSRLYEVIAAHSFNHLELAVKLRESALDVGRRVSSLYALSKGLGDLGVRSEQIEPGRAEVGLLLPRTVVGESLALVTAEFAALAMLCRTVGRLQGLSNTDPRLKTVSSEDAWQVYIDVDLHQVPFWVTALERILAQCRTSLQIRKLQVDLQSHAISRKLTDQLEQEIDRKVRSGMAALVAELCNECGHPTVAADDDLKEQLLSGLRHLARRLNQGSEVEINLGPAEAMEGRGERWSVGQVREWRERAQAVSLLTTQTEHRAPELLRYFVADAEKAPARPAPQPSAG